MAAKAAAVENTEVIGADPTDDEINAMGCWHGPAVRTYIARKAFPFRDQSVAAGQELSVADPRIAKGLIAARYLHRPEDMA